jgi:hypothetical protein
VDEYDLQLSAAMRFGNEPMRRRVRYVFGSSVYQISAGAIGEALLDLMRCDGRHFRGQLDANLGRNDNCHLYIQRIYRQDKCGEQDVDRPFVPLAFILAGAARAALAINGCGWLDSSGSLTKGMRPLSKGMRPL